MHLYLFVFNFYTIQDLAGGAAFVIAAPQIALRVVENHFAIAMSGALKMLLELGSALMEDARSAIFLSFPANVELQLFLKSLKSACGC